VRTFKRKLPKTIDRILIKATHKKPSERYPDAASFAKALTQAFPQTAYEAHRITGLLPEVPQQASPPQRSFMNTALWLTLAGGLLAILGIAYNVPQMIQGVLHPQAKHQWLPLPYTEDFQMDRKHWPTGEQFHARLRFLDHGHGYQVHTQDGKQTTTLCPGHLVPMRKQGIVKATAILKTHPTNSNEIHGVVLFFDAHQKNTSGYFLAVRPRTQQYALIFVANGKKHWLQSWTKTKYLRPNRPNTIALQVKQGTLTPILNEYKLPPRQHNARIQGRSCIFVQQGGVRVDFTRFEVMSSIQH
ncbi:MAG: hypothetical protein AAGJ35_08645, partial [Myxococcota bacterium]